MADYTSITNAQVDPKAPVTSELMYALRDNPTAIAEGAVGAPSVLPNIASRTTNAGLVGSYALCRRPSGGASATGATAAGSSLQYTDTGATVPGVFLSGTWRCMGYAQSDLQGTLWLRIS